VRRVSQFSFGKIALYEPDSAARVAANRTASAGLARRQIARRTADASQVVVTTTPTVPGRFFLPTKNCPLALRSSGPRSVSPWCNRML
jgi:hypothetical protein